MTVHRLQLGLAILAVGLVAAAAGGEGAGGIPVEQSEANALVTGHDCVRRDDPWSGVLFPPDDPDDPVVKAYIAHRRQIRDAEREMKYLRAHSFRGMRNQEIRQVGLLQLAEWKDPIYWPSLVEVFEREEADVRNAILDIFENASSDVGDAALMWQAIVDADAGHRAAALERVKRRHAARAGAGESALPDQAKRILAHALKHGDARQKGDAAVAIKALRLLEAIPLLITAQISSGGAQTSGTGGIPPEDKSLAWILIGRQQAYVADVTPVVGNGSVAFEPELGILTTGSILRIIDAVTIIYHTEVHGPLVDMTSEAWGQSTAGLGWDIPAWHAWYADEFLPSQAAAATETGAPEAESRGAGQ